ncbi:type I glutamate--ammonia ligase [Asaia astilbis]|uniref:glutamine synthetase family protein n=1 Tax=Asaia astilbis TaxID=610244 RepID=UPI00056669A7|nr:glutamine synthetase family protein [Asaia astilbis]
MSQGITYFLWNDLTGTTRTRGVPTNKASRYGELGLGWACAGQALTAFGHIVSNPWGPVDEARQIPDPKTAFTYKNATGEVRWSAVICDSKLSPDTDWACCARTFYRQALDDLKSETGLTLAVACEHEFVLDDTVEPLHGFTLGAALQRNAFLEACDIALQHAGVIPETLEPEYGRGQFEISCSPSLGITGADHIVIAREIIRAVASDLGTRASFTPKATATAVGNGAHIHFSLVDAEGKNVTHDPSGIAGLSQIAAHFCAGVLEHLDALVAFSSPTPVSYSRLRPQAWSCGYKCIGVQNREAALRIAPSASSDPERQRNGYNVEFRASDGCASPYLTLGAITRAGLDGIRRKLSLPAPINHDPASLSETEREARGITPLPVSLEAALDALQANDVVCSWFSKELLDVYVDIKKWEIAEASKLADADLYTRYLHAY